MIFINFINFHCLLDINMILNETMWLYPPIVSISRHVFQAHQIGLLNIVANTNLIILISVLHQSKELWGHDAHMFKPKHWEILMITNDANGNYRGHHNATINFNTFVPFGGNRICLGWNLAHMITKLLLSMMLLHFNFSISPSYHHLHVNMTLICALSLVCNSSLEMWTLTLNIKIYKLH
jgi:PHYB activation tagged suppressor 1